MNQDDSPTDVPSVTEQSVFCEALWRMLAKHGRKPGESQLAFIDGKLNELAALKSAAPGIVGALGPSEIIREGRIEVGGSAMIGPAAIARSMAPGQRVPFKDQAGVEIGYADNFRDWRGSTLCDVYLAAGLTHEILASLMGQLDRDHVYPINADNAAGNAE